MFKYVEFEKVETEFTVLEFRGQNDKVKVNHFDVDVVSLEGETESDIDTLISSQAIDCKIITQDEFKAIVINTTQFSRIKKQVDEKYSKDVSVLTSLYPAVERETWATQLSQAKAFKISGDVADAPFLKTLADAENDTVDSFADAVISKSISYAAFMAEELAAKRAYEKRLMNEIGL